MEQFYLILVVLIVAFGGGIMFKKLLERAKLQKEDSGLKKDWLKKRQKDFLNVFRGDKPAELKPFLERDHFMFIKHIPYRIEGIDEAIKAYVHLMSETGNFSSYNQQEKMISADAAIVTFNWSRGPVTGKTTHVWTFNEAKGSWQLIHDHTSYNPGNGK